MVSLSYNNDIYFDQAQDNNNKDFFMNLTELTLLYLFNNRYVSFSIEVSCTLHYFFLIHV